MGLLPWFNNSLPPATPPDRWSVTQPLLALTNKDILTIGDAYEGIAILGGVGAGKTSSSGFQLAYRMLELGFSGLVCTVKIDECDRWRRLAKLTGRENDLVVFDPDDGRHRFNFLAYEVERAGAGAGLTENVITLLEELSEVIDRVNGRGGGRDEDGFWRQGARRLARNAIDLLMIGTGTLSVPFLCELIADAPRSREEAESPVWKANSSLWLLIERGRARPKSPAEEQAFEDAVRFFLRDWSGLADKTRSIILAKLTGILDVFTRGKMRELFSTDTTITPDEALRHGKIIVVNLPLKEYYEIGLLAQTVWRSEFQRAVERRPVSDRRPTFVYVDEAQHLIVGLRDMHFAATARQSRCANIWLTQNISNLYVALGGHDAGQAAADSLLGLCQTKIFHSNSDPVTNQWAANLLGRRKQRFMSISVNHPPVDPLPLFYQSPQFSTGLSEAFEQAVQPHEFARIPKGGPANRMQAGAIVFQGGRVWSSGETYLFTSIKQGF